MRDDSGQFSTPADKSITDESEHILGAYVDSLTGQKPSTSDTTVVTRRREVRYWLAFCEEYDIDPLAATESHVRSYIQAIIGDGLADTTIGSYFRSVQSFYSIVSQDSLNDELRLSNGHPTPNKRIGIDLTNDYGVYENTAEYQLQNKTSPDSLEGVRESSTDVLLAPQTVEKLFDSVPGKSPEQRLRNEIGIRLLWYTACRGVEVTRLKIGAINWERCSISLKSAKINPKENPELARRLVFFPREFKTTLRRWVERVRHSHSSGATKGEGNILVSNRSDSMDSTTLNRVVKQAAANAGVQKPLRPSDGDTDSEQGVDEWLVTSHRLRRSSISHLVNDTSLNIDQVRRIAGHSSIEMTKTYVESSNEGLADEYHSNF